MTKASSKAVPVTGVSILIDHLKLLMEHPKLDHYTYTLDGKKWIGYQFEDTRGHDDKDIIELIDCVNFGLNTNLIDAKGGHHVSNRNLVRQAGYSFEAGEYDSFGPLTSVIVAGDYRICYG